MLDATTKNFIVEYYAELRELQIEIRAEERSEEENIFQTLVAAGQKQAEEPVIVIEAGEIIPSSPKIMVPSKAEVVVGPTIRFDPKTREVHRESLPRTHWLNQKCGQAFIAQAKMANQPLLFHLWHWNGKIVDGRTRAEVLDFNHEVKPFNPPATRPLPSQEKSTHKPKQPKQGKPPGKENKSP